MRPHRNTTDRIDDGDPGPRTWSRRWFLGAGIGGAGAVLLAPGSLAAAASDPYAVVRGNWFAYLTGIPFDSSDPAIKAGVAAISSGAQQVASTMETASSRTELWTDLPLGTVSANARNSFNRLKQMALAYATPGTALTGDGGVLAQIQDGLNFLMTNTYTTNLPPRGYDNWWDWQIGIPNAIEDTTTLLYDHLAAADVTTYCTRIDHFTPDATIAAATGANLLWWCRILIVGGALSGDSAKIGHGIAALSPALVYSLFGDGLYADGSFFQHSAHVAYLGGYGTSFFDTISTLTRTLAGSPWSIADPNVANIYDGINRGLVPSVWDGLAMDSMRGREIARSTSADADTGLRIANTVLRFAESAPSADQARQWKSIAKGWLQRTPVSFGDSSAATIELISRCEAVLKDSTVPAAEPSNHKIYYENDRAIHRRPGWALSISACSARVARYECINNENLHGWHTGDGMTYLYLDSDRTQFDDAFWNTIDSTRLPGTTADTAVPADAAGSNTRPTTTWTGGAVLPDSFGTGTYGAFGQDLEGYEADSTKFLSAKKSWFCLDDSVVALGAGITGNAVAGVETIVENRNLHGNNGTALVVDGQAQDTALGWAGDFPAAQWAHIDGVAGYVFPGAARGTLHASRTNRTGSWIDINPNQGDTSSDTRPYLTLSFRHGTQPSGATYSYILLPKASRAQTADRAADPGLTVLANSATAQGISHSATGLTMVNFFAAGSAGPITASGPASVIARCQTGKVTISVADPTRSQATVTVTLDHQRFGYLSTPDTTDGIFVLSSDQNRTTLLVEVGGAHGRSRTTELTKSASAPAPRAARFLAPVADAFVRDGSYATTNFGTGTQLEIKRSGSGTGNTGYSRRALLQFDTSQVSGPAKRAVLWFNGRVSDSGGLQTQLQAYASAGVWTEQAVNWDNAPSAQTALGAGWLTASQDWVGLDVTAAFSGSAGGTTSFSIWQPQNTAGLLTYLNSREASGARPMLEIIS